MNTIRFNILLRAIKEGDGSAFKELYSYFLPKITLHVKTKFPSVSPDEVAQEFFFWLTSTKNLPYVKNPTSWVYAICDNYAKKYLHKEEILVEQVDIVDEIDYYNNEIISGVASEIFSALDDDISRKVIYLYYWQGYNLREISDLLHENKSTIKQKHTRAIKKLRKIFNKL